MLAISLRPCFAAAALRFLCRWDILLHAWLFLRLRLLVVQQQQEQQEEQEQQEQETIPLVNIRSHHQGLPQRHHIRGGI